MLIGLCLLLVTSADRNQAFQASLQAVLRQPADYQQAMASLEALVPQDCRVNLQISLLSLRMDNPPDIESNLTHMLDCTPEAVSWLYLIVPQRTDLALRAAQLYPQEPQAWFWLGDLAKASGDLTLANQYFSESVRLDPSDGLAWCRLGWVNEAQGLLPASIDAFGQCCQNGDPGSNGCYGAGRVAEKLGDIPAAIHYYRLSHWQTALERAAELEGSQ